jgi:sedoheptulokinase
VSVVSDKFVRTDGELELRPYLFGKYLLSGSSLCGGRAYAVLEKFFSEYAYKVFGNNGSQYETMNSLAYEAYKNGTSLSVSTLFCGTRKNPDVRGSIVGIDDKNFTPANLVSGVLFGMVNELKLYFDSFGRKDVLHVVASGNAVKKNNVLQIILKDVFGMDVTLTSYDEEAAIGCALFSGVVSSQIDLACVENIIREKKHD